MSVTLLFTFLMTSMFSLMYSKPSKALARGSCCVVLGLMPYFEAYLPISDFQVPLITW
ncbi:hypothetical protein D1872_284410 [compost metagenome]